MPVGAFGNRTTETKVKAVRLKAVDKQSAKKGRLSVLYARERKREQYSHECGEEQVKQWLN